MSVLFISDLHLDPERPETIRLFLDFAEHEARAAKSLYILGDLFEAWVGDDEDEPGLARVRSAIRDLTARQVPVFVMHGNRDFLLGPRFESETGCALLGDFETVDIHGARVLLTHGDLLCTDDTAYQNLRATVRKANWQTEFLAKPIDERRAIAAQMRATSRTEIAVKAEDIMDVNRAAVLDTMRRFGVRHLLHGHTHRPGIHDFELDGAPAKRIVLGDWHDTGSYVRWSPEGFTLSTYPG